jgi:5-methylcytosine-specific restriction enzyme B
MNLWLIPGSNDEARENLSKTMANPISEDRLLSAGIDHSQRDMYAWGTRLGTNEANLGKWQNMSKGDLCLFYTQGLTGGNKAYHWMAHITQLQRSSQLSNAFWDNPEFELVYFLDKPRKILISIKTLSDSLKPYRENYLKNAPLGFMRVDQDVVNNIINSYGSLDKWVGRIVGTEANESEETYSLKFINLMQEYNRNGTVFQSPSKAARYYISAVDETGCSVERIDAKEPVRVTEKLFQSKLEKIRDNGGQYRFNDLDSTAATRTTVLQGLPFGLSHDKNTILDLSDDDKACKVFCEIVKKLRVDTVDGQPRLYKPAMLACIIEALESGELKENKIAFDGITPRFINKMRSLGVETTADNAAMPFFHLTGDLFWMLCYYDTKSIIDSELVRPTTIRSRVRHAIIKDTFWLIIQKQTYRKKVLAALAEKWWPDGHQFWWVNQGKSFQKAKEEGCIWAPKENRRGKTEFHWENVFRVKKGDIIFNYANRKIRAVSIAQSDGYENIRTKSSYSDPWGDEGWRADLSYYEIAPPIPVEDIGSSIAKLNFKYGPIDRTGGANQGYLYKLNKEVVEIISNKLSLQSLPTDINNRIADFIDIDQPNGGAMPEIEIVNHIYSWMEKQGFVISKADLTNFYCCLRTKPFVLLAGISGTGKTKLVRLFAEAVGATEENHRFQLIPVRPDWNDNSELLGFFDLNNLYQPGALIPLIIRAHANPDKPYFLCLDEMNLARVEHYFSDFLSIIESRRFHRGKVITDQVLSHKQMQKMNEENLNEEVQSVLTDLKRQQVKGLGLPENLYVIGTVNMDETTHPFSRKVLDRANTIEFSDVHLTKGLTITIDQEKPNELDLGNDAFRAQYLTMIDLLKVDQDIPKEISERLNNLNNTLSKAGCQIGYRVRDEAAFYMKNVIEIEHDTLDKEAGFERVILQKILPRLQGSSYQIKAVLEDLLRQHDSESKDFNFDDEEYTAKMQTLIENKGPLVKKIGNMLIQFMEDGFTSFWAN